MTKGVTNDPRVRRDGRCLVCKKERPSVAVMNNDPFCSSECCRKEYARRAAAQAA